MRREPQNPFGTSMIDLLVGTMMIVAMLWVANAANLGYRGSGESDRTSGMATIEQFGLSHIHELTLRHGNRITATYEIDIASGLAGLASETLGPGVLAQRAKVGALSGLDAFRKVTYRLTPPGESEEVAISFDVVASSDSFRSGVRIIVDKLDDVPLEAALAIEPCCDSIEPHYITVDIIDGDGASGMTTLWHEFDNLNAVLSSPIASAPSWAQSFARKIVDGLPVGLVGFDGGAAAVCDSGAQRSRAGTLLVRFDPDGDVTLATRNVAEDLSPTAHAAFLASFASRLQRYARPLP